VPESGERTLKSDEIAGLLQPFLEKAPAEVHLAKISIYIDLLLRWNARINLTAVRDPQQIVTRHFGESFFLARHLFPSSMTSRVPHPSWFSKGGDSRVHDHERSPRPSTSIAESGEVRVIDIGSGAGFPGLPLKIWSPAISLTLIESNHRKAAFLREVIRSLTLTDVNVITARAETLVQPATPGPGVAPADVVTLRAVERFDAMLPIATRLLTTGGRLAILIGTCQAESLPTIASDIQWAPPIPIPLSHSRVLSIGIHH